MDRDAKSLKLKQLLWKSHLHICSLKRIFFFLRKDFKRLCGTCAFSDSSYCQMRQRQLSIILHAMKQK